MSRRLILTIAAAVVAIAAPAPSATPASGPPTIRVQGRQLVDGGGRAVQLRGVNRAAFESRCTYDDTGFNDGPVDQASVTAMKSWKINAVRVTLNDQCWLGVNGLPAGGNAAGYRSAVLAYISASAEERPLRDARGRSLRPRRAEVDADRLHAGPRATCRPSGAASRLGAQETTRGIVFDPVTEVGHGRLERPAPRSLGTVELLAARLHDRLHLRRRAALRCRRAPVARRARSAPPAPRSRSSSAASTTTPI